MTRTRVTFLPVLLLLAAAVLFAGDDKKTVRIKVDGMTCGSCAMKVQNALGTVEGVEKAAPNVKGGYADVTFASAPLPPEVLYDAVTGAGFRASAMPAADAGAAAAPGAGSAAEQAQEKAKKQDAAKGNEALDDVRAKLAKIKNGLMMDGAYSCCIAPSCDFCALAMNSCPCGDNLVKGKPVCGECKGGWMAGHGTVPDVDPKDVKTPPEADVKKMYERRADLVKKSKPAKDDKP